MQHTIRNTPVDGYSWVTERAAADVPQRPSTSRLPPDSPVSEPWVVTEPERPTPPARLDYLTSLRFFAAAFVLFGHTQSSGTYTSPVLRHIFAFPFAGVTFFFTLSGFVLFWSYRPSVPARGFYLRRFARLWPLYALVTVLLFPIGWMIHYSGWSFGDYVGVWVIVLLALQAFSPLSRVQEAVNPPNWSLSVEAFFYLLFPWLRRTVARFRPQWLDWIALALMVLIAGIWIFEGEAPWAYFFSGGRQEPLRYVPALVHLPEFVLGMVLAFRLRHRSRFPVRPAVAVALVVVWLAALGWLHWARFAWFPMSLDAFAELTAVPLGYVLIGAYAGREIAGRRSVLGHRWLVRLGDWSYALYLVNLTIVHVTFMALGTRVFGGIPELGALGMLVLSVLVSGLLHIGVERPAQRLILRLAGRRAARRPAAAAPAEPIGGHGHVT